MLPCISARITIPNVIIITVWGLTKIPKRAGPQQQAMFYSCNVSLFQFDGRLNTGADPDKNMTFSKPIMTDMPCPFPGNAQEIDFSVLGV